MTGTHQNECTDDTCYQCLVSTNKKTGKQNTVLILILGGLAMFATLFVAHATTNTFWGFCLYALLVFIILAIFYSCVTQLITQTKKSQLYEIEKWRAAREHQHPPDHYAERYLHDDLRYRIDRLRDDVDTLNKKKR